MKSLLTATALIEVITGLALLFVPSTVVSLLLGASLTESSGVLLGRIGGAALISLSVACWQSRNNAKSSVIVIKAFVFYNVSAFSLLLYAVLAENFSGIGLWPAVFCCMQDYWFGVYGPSGNIRLPDHDMVMNLKCGYVLGD